MSFPGTCESAITTQHLLASDSVDREVSSIILGDLDWAVAVKGQMFKPLLYCSSISAVPSTRQLLTGSK